MTRALKLVPPAEDDLGAMLEKAAKHLLNRVLDPKDDDEMTVAEETQALKACSNYYAMTKKLPPPNKDGDFNGNADAIAALSRGNGRRGPADGFSPDDGL